MCIVLDGVGVGELPDAQRYGDEGSNTLANTADAVGGLHLPHMQALGLGNILPVKGIPPTSSPQASFGKMVEVSRGKDSTTGHWELCGLIIERDFPTFPHGFPETLLRRFLDVNGSEGYLGNIAASGTAIIQQLGDEHVRTGFPIVYTSADSVFQIAAHEDVIPLDRLYEMCQLTRDKVCIEEFAVGRVIARPFIGIGGAYTRTTNRRDFSLLPPSKTVLDVLSDAGVETIGIGKVDDLFAGRGLKTTIHTKSNAEGIKQTIDSSRSVTSGFVFTNLVDFDSLYGHRNDPRGFADALVEFDASIPAILETLDEKDLLILTADHGNDPVTPSTDHSREYVPLLCLTKSRKTGVSLGIRSTFADLGKSVAEFFHVPNSLSGTSFLSQVL
ncbi:MAG: phosphopentomutase [Bacteroidota bacterium]